MSTLLLLSLIVLLVSSASAQYEIRTMYADPDCAGSPHILKVTGMASGCTVAPCQQAVRGGYFETTCDSSYSTAGFPLVTTEYNSTTTTCSGGISTVVGLAFGCHASSGPSGGYFFATCSGSGYEVSTYSDPDCTIFMEQELGSFGCSDNFKYECDFSTSSAVTASFLFVVASAMLSVLVSF